MKKILLEEIFLEGDYPPYEAYCKNNCTKKAIQSFNYLERAIYSNQNDKKAMENYRLRVRETRLNYCDTCGACSMLIEVKRNPSVYLKK